MGAELLPRQRLNTNVHPGGGSPTAGTSRRAPGPAPGSWPERRRGRPGAAGQAGHPESPRKGGVTLCGASHRSTVGARVLRLPAEAQRAETPLGGNAGAGPLQGSSQARSHVHPGPTQPRLSHRAQVQAGPPAGTGRLSQPCVCPRLLSNKAAGGTEHTNLDIPTRSMGEDKVSPEGQRAGQTHAAQPPDPSPRGARPGTAARALNQNTHRTQQAGPDTVTAASVSCNSRPFFLSEGPGVTPTRSACTVPSLPCPWGPRASEPRATGGMRNPIMQPQH